ncbi:MAG: tRNA (guanosine(46)-N7)-methyltransferase TrmB [Psychroflexus sp.]|jgi:tRNA (guanine-N7-)-methyltransferase|nr:tRNA (guanosine(46)-N7)-methyltransferase TrmB [Psychroflexus sp.]MDR9449422.1 tRNA (guanosine(46)-N7)-methyltransferase TrmB [Psychroflexus sp.]
MGSKNKLKRFKDNDSFPNVIQPSRDALLDEQFTFKGKWREDVFKNNRPLIVELGCGKGEYSVGLAKCFPDNNYIGIDIKGARFWRGAKTALEDQLENVIFIRTQIELIEHLFETSEVDEIWITFPDPQIKPKREKHRLTNPDFLNRYRNILKEDGLIHLKTDSEFMFGYTQGLLTGLGDNILYAHQDIYKNEDLKGPLTEIQTFYEKKFLEDKKPITYLKFKLN